VVVLGVNERDHGTIYNAQLIFDGERGLVLHRRKITPTYHERWCGGRATARACAPSTRTSAAWARSPAGSTTTRWRAMR